MKKIAVFVSLIILCSCTSMPIPQQTLDPQTFYKRDMIINGIEGVQVLPRQDSYPLHIEARGQLDLFIMTSCSKEYTKEKAWNVSQRVPGFLGWGSRQIPVPNEIDITYYPTDLEKDGMCDVEFSGLDSAKGKHSWSFLSFESPAFLLSAVVECNGETHNYNGVSVCQSRQGLKQRISFPEHVIASAKSTCGISGEGKQFEFSLQKDYCVTLFRGDSGKLHKLTTLGYTSIMIRN